MINKKFEFLYSLPSPILTKGIYILLKNNSTDYELDFFQYYKKHYRIKKNRKINGRHDIVYHLNNDSSNIKITNYLNNHKGSFIIFNCRKYYDDTSLTFFEQYYNICVKLNRSTSISKILQ
jgi:hypothetical protein